MEYPWLRIATGLVFIFLGISIYIAVLASRRLYYKPYGIRAGVWWLKVSAALVILWQALWVLVPLSEMRPFVSMFHLAFTGHLMALSELLSGFSYSTVLFSQLVLAWGFKTNQASNNKLRRCLAWAFCLAMGSLIVMRFVIVELLARRSWSTDFPHLSFMIAEGSIYAVLPTWLISSLLLMAAGGGLVYWVNTRPARATQASRLMTAVHSLSFIRHLYETICQFVEPTEGPIDILSMGSRTFRLVPNTIFINGTMVACLCLIYRIAFQYSDDLQEEWRQSKEYSHDSESEDIVAF
ncbi:unnamed protein product [Clonostachys rosea f. rosea IK726]|uniref:Uncharacterized protein n=2 Tax=Bionectria ochroleuca TaxID=29856 RepID=A0A0B7KK92_BIOOC|nr:unnamed protein product [Clonostachys rosea f. rosea IK726]